MLARVAPLLSRPAIGDGSGARIALYHNLPPGGALRVVRESIVALSRLPGVIVELFTLDMGERGLYGDTADFSYPGAAAVHVTKVARSPSKRLRGADRPLAVAALRAAERRVAQTIDQFEFDAVIVHHCQLTHSPAILLHLRTPTIYYLHEARRSTTDYTIRPRLTERQHGLGQLRALGYAALDTLLRVQDIQAARAAGTLLTNSHNTADMVFRTYGRRAAVVYPGIDLQSFAPAPVDRLSRVLSVGALHPSKGHDLVIRSVARISRQARPDVVVVNDRATPGYSDQLRHLAENLGVSLDIRSCIDEDSLVELYRSSCATICAADVEPLGLTPLESIACGTPVVAIAEGGYRETIQDGVNGILAERSETALAEAISSIMEGRTTFDPSAMRSSVDPRWRWDRAARRLLDACVGAKNG